MIKGVYRGTSEYNNRVEKFGNELLWGISYTYKPQMPFCDREIDSTLVHIVKEVDVYNRKANISINIEVRDNKLVNATVDVIKCDDSILDSACEILTDYTLGAIKNYTNSEIKVSNLVHQFITSFKYYRGLVSKVA